MEQNKENRTEPPSKRKLAKARKRGEVAVSRELSGALGVVAGSLGLVAIWHSGVAGIAEVARSCWEGQGIEQWRMALYRLIELVAVVGGSAMGATLLIMGLQVGLRFRLKVDWKRLDPVKGLARMFSRQRLLDLVIMLFKLSLLGLTGFWMVYHLGLKLLFGWSYGLEQTCSSGSKILIRLLAVIGAVVVLFGFLDLILQRRRYFRKMRMTRKEVLDERKDQEGDPAIKSERKRRHRQLLNGVGFPGLRRASVVVVNPTHLAVALRYQPQEDQAPWVVISGRGSQAARIRAEAVRLGIPVIQQVPLARALMGLEPGEEIPEQLYQATSEVIRAIQDYDLLPAADRV